MARARSIRSADIGHGVALSYVQHGSGDPVVLVHGSLADHTYWERLRQIALLGEWYRVIAYRSPQRPGGTMAPPTNPTKQPSHVTIFGGTGRTGRHLVERALEAGHHVTLLARTPGKLAFQHERLRVVEGDVQDPTGVTQAVEGSGAVLSALGPPSNTPDYQVSRGMAHIIGAMKAKGVRRLVISAGAGVGGEGDQPKLFNHLISFVLKIAARHVLEDMTRTVQAVRSSDRDWTVVRVPMLTDDPAKGSIRVGRVGVNTGPRVTRADMARFMLEQLNDTAHVRASPVVSN